MAIKDFYPAIRPALDLNFTGSRSVDPRITFSRSGTGDVASYFDEKGVMRFAPPNVPRIDFDPVTIECKGLLIEEQRTNLMTYSERFDNTVWVKRSATITTDATDAPNGTLTADKFEATGESASYLYQGKTLTQGQEYVLSVYVKNISGGGQVWLRDFTEAGIAKFDIINGTLISSEGIASSSQIVNFGNGWYRISAVFTPTIATANHNLSCINSGSQLVGNAFYVWGAQLEQGSFPTSYIPTTSAQVTRSADGMSITGSNFSSFFNANEGTVVIESEYFGPNTADLTTTGIVTLSDGATNYFSIVARTDANSARAAIFPGSTITTVNNNYPRNTSKKIALAYKNNDFGFCIGGEAVYTDNTNQSNANINSLIIGAYYATTSRRLNGRIKRITIYNRRIANVQLQALTA